MEAWATVTIVLGTNIITGLITLYITMTQMKHSEKQLQKQLESKTEAEARQRRREIKSEPLLKLRAELARMASKQQRLVALAHRQHTRSNLSDEQVKKILQEAIDDWNKYMANGDLDRTLFIQDNVELIDKVNEINKDYAFSYVTADLFITNPSITTPQAMKDALHVFDKNKVKIAELQSLINKRLEEL